MPDRIAQLKPRIHSVRSRLLLVAALPFIILLPLLLLLVNVWGGNYYDRLLTFKVNSDLAVAHQYFYDVVDRMGQNVSSLGSSHALIRAVEGRTSIDIHQLLVNHAEQHALDFLQFVGTDGVITSSTGKTHQDPTAWPIVRAALAGNTTTAIDIFSREQLQAINPQLAQRARLELVPTPNAVPKQNTEETRGMMIHSAVPVYDGDGRLLGVLEGGMLLNQNLNFVDTINALVYTNGSLPLGSDGTATLFIDDVRIATNVRLFGDKRALGTRASAQVHEHVLLQNRTWLDRAFVVHDWYISAYEPIHDSFNRTVGMLYVGYLETPFSEAKQRAVIVLIALFVVICGAGVLFSLRLSRAIYQPVEAMNATISAVEQGALGTRTGATHGAEELGKLSMQLDHLLDTVKSQNDELKAWGESLDLKVSQRTAELEQANTLLRETQRQLALSEKLAAIGEITAGVAHEINNPVAVLQGNLDVLRETLGKHAEPLQDELRLMDQQLHRINILVTKLLQFASPTEYAGYTELLAVDSVVADALVLTRHLLSKNNIVVEEQALATRRVSINRNELQQVLINLISNAVNAMPEGGQLKLSCEDCDDVGGQPGVAIQVRDSGYGISPDNLPRVFDAFFTTRPGKGTGLGLSISYTLVARYGGRITVNSTPGDGTLFTVWLPSS